MERDLWQLVGFVLTGMVPWLGGYVIQRSGGWWSVLIRPPRWMVWLCGNPRGDGRIDLGGGGMQLTALIPLIGGPFSLLLGMEFRLRLAIVISVYLVAVVMWLLVMGWVNRRQRVGPTFEMKRALYYAKKGLLEGVEERVRRGIGMGFRFTILRLKGNRAVIPVDFTLWDNLSEDDRQAAQDGLFKTVVSCLKDYREVKVEFREAIPWEVEQRLEHGRESELGHKLTWEAVQENSSQ